MNFILIYNKIQVLNTPLLRLFCQICLKFVLYLGQSLNSFLKYLPWVTTPLGKLKK
jgi:hypothetical protein